MLDERREKTARLLRAQVLEGVIAATIAAFVELRIDEEAVLQTVNTDLGRLLIRDRAQVSQYLHAPLVRLADHRLQLRTRDVYVRLDGGHPMVRPKVHRRTAIVGPF